MEASNDFILRNSLKQMKRLCMHWINDPVGGEQAGRVLKAPRFYFHSIGVSFVDGGLQSRPVSALRAHTHTQNECLFNGLGASRVMISPESGPPRAEAALTAAEPQVGQRGTTETGRNSCPPTPWEVWWTHWMDGSGVLDAQQDLSIHLPWHLLQIHCLLLPYHLPLASHQAGPLYLSLSASLHPSGALYSHDLLSSEAHWSK